MLRAPLEISIPPDHGQHSGLAGACAAALLAAALARPAEAATGDVDADVVFVADASGEFARTVPYQTAKPMLVVGDAGLTPTAWHWSWFEYGAPQLQHRFQEHALPRRMNAEAWAAWVAVKAVTQAAKAS